LGEEIKKLEKTLAEREGHAGTLLKNKTKAEEHLRTVEKGQPEGKKELDEIRRETQEILEKRSSLQKELGRLEAKIELVRGERKEVMADARALLEAVRSVKQRLLALTKDNFGSELPRIIEILDKAANGNGSETSKTAQSFENELKNIHSSLSDLEKKIKELKEREEGLQKEQDGFYVLFKEAVSAVEKAKDELEAWTQQTQSVKFEKERLEIRRSEWEHQVRQAGRTPDEFKDIAPGSSDLNRSEIEKKIFRLRGDLASMGDVDEALVKEARDTETRYEFLKKESGDLVTAKDDLKKLISELNEKIKTEFSSALVEINEEFNKFFGLMFGGGHAKLKLRSPEKKTETLSEEDGPALPAETEIKDKVNVEDEEEPEEGIEIDLKLPKRKITSLTMLSGGERSLVGIAALFAMISVSPPPFLVLDEIDAALDESNARRFSEMLKEFSKKTQFVIVTHNRATMEAADVLYGVTLGEDDASKIVSLKLEKTA